MPNDTETMLHFHASDWFTIKARGPVATFTKGECARVGLHHPREVMNTVVLIDRKKWRVVGVETHPGGFTQDEVYPHGFGLLVYEPEPVSPLELMGQVLRRFLTEEQFYVVHRELRTTPEPELSIDGFVPLSQDETTSIKWALTTTGNAGLVDSAS